jgi:dTDP-4-dehydrorhamnose reductase
MRILILGGTGMLGHKLQQSFAPRFDTFATVRSSASASIVEPAGRLITDVTAEDLHSVSRALDDVEPQVVVNCIGIVKQLDAAKDPIPSIEVNALFPHRLADAAKAAGARTIHISTDCVFSGLKGRYTEEDPPDPVDLYGRTKLLGEVSYDNTLTIRTSIVGRELIGAHGLLEWFLAQSGPVKGFRKAIFSGLTTQALAETLALVITDYPDLSGLWHVASEPIDKYQLLREFARLYDRDVEIEPDDSVVIDRSLDDARFRAATGIARPSWPELLEALAKDPTPYDDARAVAC